MDMHQLRNTEASTESVLGRHLGMYWFDLLHTTSVDIDMLVTNFRHAEAGDPETGRIILPAVVNLLRRGSFVRS
jgi:hypothetical protein